MPIPSTRDLAGMQQSYQVMYDAYVRIFNRFGLEFRAVAADNGAIGGSGSHEFHVIADTGEDALVYCPTSDYAANMEAAEAMPLADERAPAQAALTKTATPWQSQVRRRGGIARPAFAANGQIHCAGGGNRGEGKNQQANLAAAAARRS